jgi:hypothetical protein
MPWSFDLRSVLPSSFLMKMHCVSTHPPTDPPTDPRPLQQTHHKFNFWIFGFCIHIFTQQTNASHHDNDGPHSRSEQQCRQTETEQLYARISVSFSFDGSYFLLIVSMYIISLWRSGLCSLLPKNNYNTGAPCLCTHGRLPQI